MITRPLEDGRTAILTPQGWRVATEAEMVGMETSPVQAFLASGVRGLLDTADLATLANPWTWSGGPEVRAQAREQAMGGITSRAEMFAPLEQAQPGAAALGSVYGSPDIVTGPALGIARRVMGTAGRRAATVAAAQAGEQAAGGAGSVGAASTGAAEAAAQAEGSFVRRTLGSVGWGRDLQRLADELLDGAPMTPDQRALVPVADSIGFRFLPGQREGNVLLNQLAMSDPLVQLSYSGLFAGNRQGLRATAARAIGIRGDDFGRDMLGQAADEIGATLDDIGVRIGEVRLADDIVERVSQVAKTEPFLALEAGGALTGRQAMALRSNLVQAASQAWRQGAQAPAGKAQFLDDLVSQLDDVIEGQLDDAALESWRIARQRWRNLRVLEYPGVISDAGEINARTLSSQMARVYGATYRRQLTGAEGRRANLLPETQALMDWARVVGAFADNMPNSGTAYRSALIQATRNPMEVGKALVLRGLIDSAATARGAAQ